MCRLFQKETFQRGNQLVQEKKINKEGMKEYFHKINRRRNKTEETSKSQRLEVVIMKS